MARSHDTETWTDTRLCLGGWVSTEWSRSQLDFLEVVKVWKQRVSWKKFLWFREVSQQIVYWINQNSSIIYVIWAFTGKQGEGMWARKRTTISLRFINNEYDSAMEEFLDQTPEIQRKRKGKRVVFFKSSEELSWALVNLGLNQVKKRWLL